MLLLSYESRWVVDDANAYQAQQPYPYKKQGNMLDICY